ncbi:MAG TPA: thioredoxin [Planctomycetota bacterium]|nr:thioredoxin [Planctomycetota bacterium]
MLAGGGGSDADAPGSDKVVVLTDATFDATIAKGVVLVDFWATWCPPCKTQGPIVDALAGQYDGKAVVGKLDVDENAKVARRFNVSSIPTLIVFRDGEVFKRFTGLQSKGDLAAALDAALKQ